MIDKHFEVLAKQASLKLKYIQVTLALGNTTKANELLKAINPQEINTSFLLYVKASYYVSLEYLVTARQLFKKSREVSYTSLKLALTYIYSLYELDYYQQAYEELLKVAPILKQTDIKITPKNQYMVSFHIQLLRKNNHPYAELSQALNQWLLSKQNGYCF